MVTVAPHKDAQSSQTSPIKVLDQKNATYSHAQNIIGGVRHVLSRTPGTSADAVDGAVITETHLGRLMFIVLNPSKMTKVSPYESVDVLKLIKAQTRFPTYWSSLYGFRYIIHMTTKRHGLPKSLNFEGWLAGKVVIGRSMTSDAFANSWHDFGHAAIAGITQFGKSNTLRVIFTQAIHEGHLVYLGDYLANTWNALSGFEHTQIKTIARTTEEYLGVIEGLIEERNRRQEIFMNCAGSPDNLDEYNHLSAQQLPRIVALLDEFPAAVEAVGGAKSLLGLRTVELLRTSLKYGIQLVIAGQDFYVNDIGHMINHCSTRICLRVNNPHLSRALVGSTGAEKLKIQGRAFTNKWGIAQIALISKEQMLKSLSSPSSGMNPFEEKMATRLWAFVDRPGWMDIDRIREVTGLSQDKARALREDFVKRGLAKHFPDRNNAIFLTTKQ